MISIALSESEVMQYIEYANRATGQIASIGCINSPCNVTVTGDIRAIELLRQCMEDKKIFARQLQVDVAYHSHHMASTKSIYIQSMGKLKRGVIKKSHPLMFSSVEARQVDIEELSSPEYWLKNLTGKVRFTEALGAMTYYLLDQRKSDGNNKSGKNVIVEIGPHSALQRPVKETLISIPNAKDIEYDSVLSRTIDPIVSLANIAGRLRCRGVPIDLASISNPRALYSAECTLMNNLPAYPFNHSQKHWHESRLSHNFRFRTFPRHELFGVREVDWNQTQPKWRNVVRLTEHTWLRDHQVGTYIAFREQSVLIRWVVG